MQQKMRNTTQQYAIFEQACKH